MYIFIFIKKLGRIHKVSECLCVLSKTQLGELCTYIISKLKTEKLSIQQQVFYHQTVVLIHAFTFLSNNLKYLKIFFLFQYPERI